MLQQEVVAGGRDNPAGRGEWSEPRSMLFPRHHPSPSTPHHRLPDPTSEHSPPLGPHGPHLFTQEGREAKTGMCVCRWGQCMGRTGACVWTHEPRASQGGGVESRGRS